MFYGIISDNLPLFKSKRKAYIILNGFIQFTALIILATFNFKTEIPVVVLLTIISTSAAFSDVIADAFMVT